jgi:Leucine-rich repeat (LRR) protein
MTILTEKFRFIRDDVFLCPQVDTETGEQMLKLEKINLETGEIEYEDWIDCIHTAITQIAYDELVEYHEDTDFKNDLIKQTLNIRSSENLKEINLSSDEKFFAFKSWAQGITEVGLNIFKIQAEIDTELDLDFIYPISLFLMHFLVQIDSDFILQFLFLIEKECMFEGKAHKTSIISNLIPLVEMITHDWETNVWNNAEGNTKIIDGILDFNPPIDLFNHKPYYLNFFLGASPKSLLKFFSNIENSDGWIKFLEKFLPILNSIEKKLSESEIEKLSKKILTVDIPLRVFKKPLPFQNIKIKELYQFYINDHDLTADFIKRAIKNLQKLNKTSIFNTNLIDSLNPIFDFLIILNNESDGYERSGKNYEEIVSALFELNPPLQLFTSNPDKTFLLKHPGAKKIRLSSEYFDSRNLKVKHFLIEHPKATEFPEFQKMFDPKLELNFDIRVKSLKRWIKDYPEKEIVLFASCVPKDEFDTMITEVERKVIKTLENSIQEHLKSPDFEFRGNFLGIGIRNNHVVAILLSQINNSKTSLATFLSNLGDLLKKFEYLEELDLSSSYSEGQIKDIPEFIHNFKFLKKLNIGYNAIKSIPIWIDSLKKLEDFNITENLITEIPESIGKLKNLRYLDLSWNKILKKLPESIGNLISLEILDLSVTKIQRLPHTLKNLKNLKEFSLNFVELDSFPEEICSLNSLEILNLGNNLIVPDTISKLYNLKELRFGRNCVLPESIGKLKSLEILFCHDDCTIPQSIGELKKLRELTIGAQCVLPQNKIGILTSLTNLWTKIAGPRDEDDFSTITSSIPESCRVYDHEEWPSYY